MAPESVCMCGELNLDGEARSLVTILNEISWPILFANLELHVYSQFSMSLMGFIFSAKGTYFQILNYESRMGTCDFLLDANRNQVILILHALLIRKLKILLILFI
jgi:hypothetical protein